MTTKHSSIVLASEGSFDTISTDSLEEMRGLVAGYAQDPNGAVLDNWEPREGTIITEVRAISARINQNFDAWPSDELREAHHTFVGKPVFVNHNNHDPDRARGRVVASRYVDAGEEDRYVQVLQEVEATRFPMLAKELMEGGLDSVSMGAEAREVECSFCANISTSPFDACEHIAMKGATLQRRTASGSPENVLVYEICRKISFFELSYVFDPADETAVASNVLVANRREAVSEVEVPPKVDTLHPDEDEKSSDDWQEYVDDPNVIDTIDVLDEPDLGLNQELERPDDEVPEGFEEFEGIDDEIAENERAEEELAQESREHSQDKADAEAEEAKEQFEPNPENDSDWEKEEDGTGGTTHRFKGGNVEAMVADDYGTFNMWVEKNGSLIASDSYTSFDEAKAMAVQIAKDHTKEMKMSRTTSRDPRRDNLVQAGRRKRANLYGPESYDTAKAAFEAWLADEGHGSEAEGPLFSTFEHKHGDGWTDDELDFDLGSVGKNARRKQATQVLEGWDITYPTTAVFDTPDFQLWVATADQSGIENWKMGEWSVFSASSDEVASGHAGSVESAAWAAITAADDLGYDTGVVPASGNTGVYGSRKTAADQKLWQEFLEYAESQGFNLDEIDSLYMQDQDASDIIEFETAMYDFLGVNSVDDDPRLYELLEGPGMFGVERRASRRKQSASVPYPGGGTVTMNGNEILVDGEQVDHIHDAPDSDEDAQEILKLWVKYDQKMSGGQLSFMDWIAEGHEASRKVADVKSDALSFIQYLQQGGYTMPKDAGYPGEGGQMDDELYSYTSGDQGRISELTSFLQENWDYYAYGASRTHSSRHNGGRRISRTNNRDISRKDSRMATQRRRRIGDNKQTPLLEDTGIAQTPAEEPAVDPEKGSDAPNSSESDRVKSARRALAREMARDRATQARRRRAKAVGQDLSGASVDREDLFENFSATTMTAQLRKRFAAWVQANYGTSIRHASGPGELRSWARTFAKEAGIEPTHLHAAIKRDVQALRTAADDDEGVKGDNAEDKDGDDIPDFIEEKIEDSKEARRKAARRAVARRRTMQARNTRGRRTQTSRRRTADDKLELAAPDERVNVEKPTSGTTDADAEASQFDKSDFDNNSGKGLENPDTTPVAGTPGGPSVNDLKRSSARASGLQAVQLAEAMIAANLIENTREAKFKAAAQFEKMSRDIVLDRTALLEKVVTANAKRPSATKSAGNRGTSLNSAVPPNMSGMTRSAATQRREASTDSDSDLFF